MSKNYDISYPGDPQVGGVFSVIPFFGSVMNVTVAFTVSMF